MNIKKFLLFCIINFAYVSNALAWDVQLEDSEYMPSSMVVVDKGAQELAYLEKHSPLSLRHKYPSIHGKLEGDKETEGDLKTPEGVYFVITRIQYPLDFEEYGSQAHALNYPNPVDRLRGKTGGGIWIHSKGKPIKSQKTEGCIAVDLAHIDKLEPLLTPGIPVVVAQQILHASLNLSDSSQVMHTQTSDVAPNTLKTQEVLLERTEEWNKAWASRSDSFFSFYDTKSYSKAQRSPFRQFQAQKEYLFGKMDWIYIKHGKINILQGPGYWVTWFNQYYRSPQLKTEGIRRLYWQANKDGEFKVVGMEWLPRRFNFGQEFVQDASRTIPEFIENWRLTWKNTDTKNYANFYIKDAVQDSHKTIDTIVARKDSIWDLKKPETIEFSNITIDVRDNAVYVKMKQEYSDSSGYKDVGIKRLVLYPHGNSWLIAHEKWALK